MGYVSTWPNAKVIGKKSLYTGEAKSVELSALNTEKKSDGPVIALQISKETSRADDSTENQSTTVESAPSEKATIETTNTPPITVIPEV